jgi:hypothetical protein
MKITDSHIDTSRIVFDEALSQRLADRTTPPDRNGCMFYSGDGARGLAIHARTADGEHKQVSVLRVAFYFAGRGHVGHGQEVAHACRNSGEGGRPLCVAPDHLVRQAKHEHTRALHRAAHVARMRKTLPGYQQAS